MGSTLTLILDPLLGLYALTFALRLGMQWVRADFRNPIVQFVLTVTNPLVAPLRKFLPPVYKVDTATLIVYVLLCWTCVAILATLECLAMPDPLTLFGLGVVYGLRLLVNTYTFIVFGYVLLSWIAQGGYNPSVAMIFGLLRELAQPVIAPVQRLIPPIAGLDLSPIFVLIAFQAIARMLFEPGFSIAAGYTCNLLAIL